MTLQLKPEDRVLFDAGREGLAPTAEDRARVAKALGLSLGGSAWGVSAAAKAAAGSATTSPAVAGISSGIVAAKWVTVIAMIVAVGTTGGVAFHRAKIAREPLARWVAASARAPLIGERASSGSADPVAMTRTNPAPPTEPPNRGEVAAAPHASGFHSFEAARARQAPASPPSSQPSAAPRLPAIAAPSPESSPTAEPAAETTSVRVAEEARLLREAEIAFHGGDAQGATRWLDEHARLFPRGVLAEERDVQRVLILCAEGQTNAARTDASRFLSAHPQSILAERVRSSCGGR